MKKFLLIFGFIVIANSVFTQPVIKTMKRLPDTGETTSYTNTPGEDADYNIYPPFFIVNGNGTATDTVTGLMWQQIDGGEMTVENAIIFCDTLTLGGFTDWRLPNPQESFSILNHQFAKPAMNATVFPNTNAEYWWSSLRQVNDASKVWCTNSGGGIGNHPKSETISAGGTKKFHVRAVRDVTQPATLPSHFTDNNDGTITDNLTNLIWKKVAYEDSITWEQALVYADTLSASGFTDWRLPNIKELQSLNDESRINPSINNSFFTNIAVNKYWSSTTLPNHTTWAWYLYTQFGITTYDDKSFRHYVLCVRGDQSVFPLKLLSFNAKLTDKKVLLTWSTTNEVNTQTCKIERSNNGRLWVSIGSVNATNSSNLCNYTWMDFKPISGNNYYRLKFIDKDGRVSFSAIQLVSLRSQDSGIIVYPNPSSNGFFLQLSSNIQAKDIKFISVYNNKGDLVYLTDKYQPNTVINCLSKGTYQIKAQLQNNQIFKKLIVQ